MAIPRCMYGANAAVMYLSYDTAKYISQEYYLALVICDTATQAGYMINLEVCSDSQISCVYGGGVR